MKLSVTFNFPDGEEIHDLEAECENANRIPDALAQLVLEHDAQGYSSVVIVAAPDGAAPQSSALLDKNQMARGFNRWMYEYTEHPERFEAEFQSVGDFLTDLHDGNEPSYGERCAAVLTNYAQQEDSDVKEAPVLPNQNKESHA